MNNLSVVEQLSYSTVQICAEASAGVSCGTGFVMSFRETDKNWCPVLVTNGHVVDSANRISLCFTKKSPNGDPDGKVSVTKDVRECGLVYHPQYVCGTDTDLCAIPLAPFVSSIEQTGQEVFFAHFPLDLLASDEDYAALMQLDEVAMVGYPNALIDTVNNQPIFRRGVLATNPSLDYEGRKEFLTDIATIGGSSGSPVLYINNGFSVNKRNGSIQIGGSECKLLGVHRGGFRYDAMGRLVKIVTPEMVKDVPRTQIPINLGLVIKVHRIKELVRQFVGELQND